MKVEKLGLSLKESQAASGVGRNSLLAAINSGELPAARIGAADSKRSRYVIRPADLDGWLQAKSRSAQ